MLIYLFLRWCLLPPSKPKGLYLYSTSVGISAKKDIIASFTDARLGKGNQVRRAAAEDWSNLECWKAQICQLVVSRTT